MRRRGRCLAVRVGNPSHSYHREGFYTGARPPDIEEVHCVWQWCICPSQAAPLAQGGALDGWRAGWARPDEEGGREVGGVERQGEVERHGGQRGRGGREVGEVERQGR